jgi:hypothetical protein
MEPLQKFSLSASRSIQNFYGILPRKKFSNKNKQINLKKKF